MSQIGILIETDNAAFHSEVDPHDNGFCRYIEVKRILEEMIRYYGNNPSMRDDVTFRDINGNTCAVMSQQLDPEDEDPEDEAPADDPEDDEDDEEQED